MKKIISTAVILLCLMMTAVPAKSQKIVQQPDKPLYWLGFYGGVNLNFHTADFRSLPEAECCSPGFKSGFGIGYALGGLFEYPLDEKWMLDIRLGFSTLDAQLKVNELIGNAPADKFAGNLTNDVEVEHTIDSRLSLLGLEPSVNYYFFDKFYGTLGFRLGYLLAGKFDQQEKIVNPPDVHFLENGLRVRNQYNNQDINNLKNFQFHILAGLGYDLTIGREWYLTPEARYYLPLMNISSVAWKVSDLQIDLALKIPVFPARELPVREEMAFIRDTTTVTDENITAEEVVLIDKSEETEEIENDDFILKRRVIRENYEKRIPVSGKITAAVDAAGINYDGTRQENPQLVIEEIEAEESFPLLPYVFFREGSADLAATKMEPLNTGAGEFNENNLEWNTMSIYSEMLNVVGSRMKKYPDAKLTVTGCNNNTGVEENNLELSEKRAEAVKNYLVKTWNIDPSRITVQSRNLPANPGNNEIKDGQIENQRAELSSDNDKILKFVTLNKVIRTSNPPRVEILPEITADAGVSSWDIKVEQSGRLLRQYSGQDVPKKIEWDVEGEPVPKTEVPVNITLTAMDNLGHKTTAQKDIAIKQLTIKKKRIEMIGDKKIERYSLILFDFDKANITPEQAKVLKEIREKIHPDSKVTIYGYADRTGDPAYNKQLADRRIQETQKVLKVKDSQLKTVPVGSNVLLYNNDTPEGRSYSRTVRIIIETPVKS